MYKIALTAAAAVLTFAAVDLTSVGAHAQAVWVPAYPGVYRHIYPRPYWRRVVVARYGFPPPYGPYGPPVVYYGPPRAYYAAPPPPPPPPPPQQLRPQAFQAHPAQPQRFEVYFPFDQSDIIPAAHDVIRAAAAYQARTPGAHMVVVGHTDTSGSDAYNDPLSRRRAEAVRETLGAEGVDNGAVEMDWKGKHDLEVATANGVKEPRNRRVTILVEPPTSSSYASER